MASIVSPQENKPSRCKNLSLKISHSWCAIQFNWGGGESLNNNDCHCVCVAIFVLYLSDSVHLSLWQMCKC